MQRFSPRTKLLAAAALFVALVVFLSLLAAHKPAQKALPKTAEPINVLNQNLPYQNSDFRIDYDYTPELKQYTYTITLYGILNRPSQYDSYTAQLKQFKQEALQYIQQHGGDPSQLTIIYIPSLATNL